MKDILEDRKLMCTHIFIGVRDIPGICHGGCGLCGLISTHPHETALENRIRYVVYVDIRLCGKKTSKVGSFIKGLNTLNGLGLASALIKGHIRINRIGIMRIQKI